MDDQPEQPKRSRGRPPGATGKALDGYIEGRVAKAHEEKFEASGGIEWLRALLDQYTVAKLKALIKSKP